MPFCQVQVCYALAERQTLLTVSVVAGSSCEQAIRASGVLHRHPEIDLDVQRIGIFGRFCEANTPLSGGERIEIYRGLTVDPKVARARRVAKARAGGSKEGRKWVHRDARPSSEIGEAPAENR